MEPNTGCNRFGFAQSSLTMTAQQGQGKQMQCPQFFFKNAK